MAKKLKDIKVPNLRFPGFEGEWQERKFGEIATNTSPKYDPNKGKGHVSCIELEHLESNNGQLLGWIDASKAGSIKNVFNTGDVLFGKLRPYLKKYIRAPFDGVCSSEIWVLKGIDVSNDFLYQLVQTDKFIDLANQSSGSKMPRADWSVVSSGIFSVPGALEQEKIATILSLLDKRISTLSKIIEKLESLIRGLREQLFTQKLRFTSNKSADFPEWHFRPLGEIGQVINGLTYSPNDIDESGVLVLRSSNVRDRALVFDDNVFVKSNDFNPVAENDILICVRNGSKNLIGKNAIVEKKHEGFAFGAFMAVYRSPHNQFLFQWFDTNQYKEEVFKNLGATINSINGGDLKKFLVPFPSQPEQQKITGILTCIHDKIQVEKDVLARYVKQKNALLKKLFI